MPRALRVEYEGAIYHVMNRGDRREPIFKDDLDRKRFVRTLGEACTKTGWQTHAWCLMPNHFHLVVETPQPNLVAGMKWFLGTYTMRFNSRHKLNGHLFGGRYKALAVDGSGTGYLRAVSDYVHLNPVRAKLLAPEQPLTDYPWSSFVEYLKPASQRASWLRVDRVLGELGIPQDSEVGRQEFQRAMEQRRQLESGTDYSAIRRGWCFGTDTFRNELLEVATRQVGENHEATQRQETAKQKAERLVQEQLRQHGWTEQDLKDHRKGDAAKVAIARLVRQETTVTLKWIAHRLEMGTWTHVTNRLYHTQHETAPAP